MNSIIKKMKDVHIITVLIILGVLVGIFISTNKDSQDRQVYVVGTHDIEQVVLLSGQVQAAGQIDLSFDATGKVTAVSVEQGDVVEKGQQIASLSTASLEADLQQAYSSVLAAQANIASGEAAVEKARANLALVQAQNRGTYTTIESAEIALHNTILQQEILVENAYQDFLNNDLTAYPVDASRSIPSPVISGSYRGSSTGEYVLDFYSSGTQTGVSASVHGLSQKAFSPDVFGVPAVLGEEGLYATLPSDGYSYANTTWVIPVPNVRSDSYRTKLGLYEKAKQTQTLAVAQAQAVVDALISQQERGSSISITDAQQQQAIAAVEEAESSLLQKRASLAQAYASVEKVKASIQDRVIFAPFSGTVGRIDFEVGQSVTMGMTGVTLVTNGEYELQLNVSELDVARIHKGDIAEVVLDAYGKEVVWKGVLESIESIETKVDGVPTYVATLKLLDADDRIRIGMNARAKIVIAKRDSVLAIPASYITTRTDVQTVEVLGDTGQEERVVETGVQGTDYFIEITQGLSEGEQILAPSV